MSTPRIRAVVAPCIVLVAASLAVGRFLLPTYDRYDWPIQLVSAARIVREIPYASVHVLYGPAGHYALGLFHLATGLELSAAARVFFAGNALVGLVLVWSLTKAWSPNGGRAAALLAVLILAGPLAVLASYSGLALNLLLVGVLLTLRTIRTGPQRVASAAACGAIVALLVLTRVNFGTYLVVGCAVAIAWSGFQQRRWTEFLAFAGAGVASASAAALAMWRAGFLLEYVKATLSYVERFRTRTLPLSSMLEQPVQAAALVGLITAGAWIGARRRPIAEQVFAWTLVVCLFSYVALRADLVHILPMTVVLVPLLLTATPSLRLEWGMRWLGIGCAVFLALSSLRSTASGLARMVAPIPGRSTIAGYSLDAGAAELVSVLRQSGCKDGDLFVASWPGSCECVSHWCANMAVYTAGGWTPRPTVWISDTAVSSWPEVQRKIIQDLEAAPPRFIAFEALRSSDCPDRRVIDPRLLSEWTRRRYRQVRSIREEGTQTEWFLFELLR